MYSNPNQMAVAAAAAAAASAAAANGSGPQRLQYPGLPHQQPPQQQHGTGNIISASRMHGAGQNGKILQSITGCEPDDAMGQSTPAANGVRFLPHAYIHIFVLKLFISNNNGSVYHFSYSMVV